eukprot:gnl/Chilomastix_caulleri/161.p1 GENE.gnl/Chilomastix_caulleri/161~~gnl/Chilomastix_caulleri/161.p1  ORF type:complete len:147 (+),score=58.18 gnl/Chilomastix_caulleri/161:73-513(+)
MDSKVGNRRARALRVFTYRGLETEKLMELKKDELIALLSCRARRKFARRERPIVHKFMAKVAKSLRDVKPGTKPATVKTHRRDVIVTPEMFGAVIGIHNGKTFVNVEIKPPMIGLQLGELAMTYKPVKHGKVGVGATRSSKFVPIK